MGAQVQAKLDLETSGFRMKLSQVDSAWGKFERKAVEGGKSMAAAFAPAAAVLGTVGTAAVLAGGAGAAVLGNFVSQGIALTSELENAQNAFAAFTGDAKKAASIVKELKNEGDLSPLFSTSDMINAGKALMSSAKGSQEELMKLVKTSELLGALNPDQGLGGGAFALREAISGDYQSLIERFNISRKMVNDLKSQGKEGMELVQEALRTMGVNTKLIDNQATSWAGLQSQASSFFDNMKMALAEPVFEELKAGLQSFANEMSGGSGSDLLTWSRDIGESLGKNVHEIIQAMKGVNWREVLTQVSEIAKMIGNAAEGAGKLAAFMGAEAVTWHNGYDRTMGLANTAQGFMDKGAEKWFEFTGWKDSAEEARKSAAANFGEADRRKALIENRMQDKQFAEAVRAGRSANTTWNDMASVRSATEDQLSPEQRARRERHMKFEEGVRQQGQRVSQQQAKAGPLNVTLNERNPMHTVMAT